MKSFIETLFVISMASFICLYTACSESSTAGNSDENEIIAEQELSDDEELASSSSKEKESTDSKKEKSGKFSGKVSGVSQKGPFIVGSKVTLYEIEGESLDQSGSIFGSKTKNDKGEFEVSYKELSSNYAMFVVDGYYRNEVTGKQSTSQITLNALSDLTNRKTVNVNILTHLEFDRVKYLVGTKGIEYGKAKAQAEKEIFDAFGISFKEGSSAEDLNIAGTTENDAALLALSVVLQGTCAEAAFSERLARIAQDLEEDGTIDDKQMLADIADEIALMDLEKVRKNIEAWKLSTSVPDFENYVESFRTASYDIGACTKEDVAKTAKNTNKLSKNYEKMYVCEESGWRVMTEDEGKYGTCAANEDGKRFEDSRICDGGKWRSLTADESMGACTEEKIGETAVEENELSENFNKKHVCDKNGWRLMTADEDDFGTCAVNEDGKRFEKSYICDGGKWRSLTADESMGACTEEKIGETVVEENELSSNFGKKHVCGGNAWHVVSALEEKLGYCTNANAHQGLSEDDQLYACDGVLWHEVDRFDYDLYTLVCEKDGDIVYSEKNKIYYVCKNGMPTTPDFDDFSLDADFTADVWNGATDSKGVVDGKEYNIQFWVDGNPAYIQVYNTKKDNVMSHGANGKLMINYDGEGKSSTLADKGVKYMYNYSKNANSEWSNISMYVSFSESGVIKRTDVSDWGGACIVYASSVPLYLDLTGDKGTNVVELPATMELSMMNLSWNDFVPLDDGGASAVETAKSAWWVGSLNILADGDGVAVGPYSGTVYVAGFGKYNGCSVK